MKVLETNKLIMVDVDDTLVLWNLSDYPTEKSLEISCYGKKTKLIPHYKNIHLLEKFHKLGYDIVVWSATGWEWADAVVSQLKLSDIVTMVMSKPRYYVDDLPADKWIGQRIYRDPKSGDSQV